jgi:hypothetical protein
LAFGLVSSLACSSLNRCILEPSPAQSAKRLSAERWAKIRGIEISEDMMKKGNILLNTTIILSALFLSNCQGLSNPNPTSTISPVPLLTNTTTLLPTLTFTPTNMPTLTETPTILATPTDHRAFNLPGLYSIRKCASFFPIESMPKLFITFCVQSVTVHQNLNMQFNVTWLLGGGDNKYKYQNIYKITDPLNHCNFIVDNLGNEYSHIDVGGAAANMDIVGSDQPSSGWFLFSPAKPNATSFTFRSICNGVDITEIFLIHGDIPTFEMEPTSTLGPYNEPGTYWIYNCATFVPLKNFPSGIGTVTLCVNTIVVNANYEMRVNVKWKIITRNMESGNGVVKPSDTNNYDIYLVDNMNNYYSHTLTGGCAAQDTHINSGGDCNGWFLFPPAKPGVTSFQFIDSANLVKIGGIILLQK